MDVYRAWEAGKRSDFTAPRIGKLKDFEKCYLLRRRKRMTQRELAKRICCTRLWVLKMEEGSAPAERLVQYWKV